MVEVVAKPRRELRERFARAIRKREHEVTLKEKELEKLKGKEKLMRDRLVENEKELMHVKMKA